MKITPIGENILIKEVKKFGTRSAGGIIMPENPEQDKYTLYGSVLGLGADVKKDVAVGDLIFTDKRRCIQYQFGENEFWMIDQKHLIGKVTPEENEII